MTKRLSHSDITDKNMMQLFQGPKGDKGDKVSHLLFSLNTKLLPTTPLTFQLTDHLIRQLTPSDRPMIKRERNPINVTSCLIIAFGCFCLAPLTSTNFFTATNNTSLSITWKTDLNSCVRLC